MKLRRTCCYFLATVSLSVSVFPDKAMAQISSDGTLSTTVSTDDAVNFLIEGGERSLDNLFHSFSEFSIPNLGSAYFDNATDITNIFSRVTGGNISDIQGLIRANGTANLFLINPAGIVFGENASLDVGGSFFATTAESVVFGDGVEFSATQPEEAPLLTVNITPGLQMGSNSGEITVNSIGHNISVEPFQPLARNGTFTQLQVSNGNTLALIGRNLTLNGGILTSEDGQIELGAISSPDLVPLNPTELGFTLDYKNVSQFGNIELTQQSLVEASEIGAIRVRGNNISVQDGSLFFIENLSSQASQGIEIQATEAIEFAGRSANNGISSGITSDVFGAGDSGDISIITPRLRAEDSGGVFRTFTYGEGDSGNITVEAADIELIGGEDEGALIIIRTLGAGNGGNLTINTQRLTLQDGALVSNVNNGSGSAGSIVVNATESVQVGPNISQSSLIASSAVSPNGNAGSITINTSQFTLEGGALISSSTFGAGNAGTITVNATEAITLAGFGRNRSISLVEPTRIRTAGVLLSEAAIESRGLPETVTGNAGEIILNTSLLQVTDGAIVSVRHDSIGNAGTLRVNADTIYLDSQGSLQGDVATGDQGNINLTTELLLLRNNSNITTNATGEATGGNITIDTVNLVALEDSDITANAVFGQGGNILITAQGLFLSPDSDITASSEFGIDGVVEINTPYDENKLAIAELPENFTDASEQIAEGCEWTRDNTFYITGRSGIAKTPQEHIQDYTMWSDIRDLSNQSSVVSHPSGSQSLMGETPKTALSHQSSPRQERIVEANAWIVNERGNVELVAVVPSNNQNLGQVASSCSEDVDS